MKKTIAALLALVMCMSLLSACGKKDEPAAENLDTFLVEAETGENIYVTLDTTDGYLCIDDPPFMISKDHIDMVTGTFTTQDTYSTYYEALKTDESGELLQEGEKDGFPFFSYKVDSPVGTEHNYFVQFPKTTLVIASIGFEEADIQAVFDALSFKLADEGAA